MPSAGLCVSAIHYYDLHKQRAIPKVVQGAERRSAGRFAGRAAIVTGAARGIGQATAGRLVAEGARVLLSDMDAGLADAAAALGQPHIISDLTADGAVEALFEAADREVGPIDVLVNSA